MRKTKPFHWHFHHLPLIGILLLGLLLRWHGFAWTLPWYFHSDEARLMENGFLVQENGLRGYVLDVTNMGNYPPYRTWEVAATKALFSVLFDDTPNGILVLFGRVFSLSYALLTILFLYHLGRRISGSRVVGWGAALFFAVWAETLMFGQRVLADGAGLMFFTLCAYLSVVAYQERAYRMLALAFGAGLLAGLGKYNYFPALMLPALTTLTFLVHNPRQLLLRAVLPGLLITLPVLLLTSQTISFTELYYRYLNESAQLEGELRTLTLQGYPQDSYEVRELYRRYPLSPALRLYANYLTLLEFTPTYSLGLALLGLGGLLAVRPRRIDRPAWVALGLCAGLTLLTFSFFRGVEGRQMFGVFSFMALLWGAGLWAVSRISPLAAMILTVVLAAPMVGESWGRNVEFTRPDTRIATARWFLDHAQDGTGIALEGIPYEFWRSNGYPDTKTFNTQGVYRLWEKTPQEWENQGFYYLVAGGDNAWRGGFYAGHEKSEFWLPYTEEVARFEGDGYVGPDRIILRAFRPQTKVEARFGEVVTLYGYDVGQTTLLLGESLHVKYFWLANQPDGQDYIVFNHLVNVETETLLLQGDRLVGNGGMSPSATWQTHQWTFDEFDLLIPSDAPAGTYRLQIGLYRASDGERLPVSAGTNGILRLLEVRIEQP